MSSQRVSLSRIVAELPSWVPFIGPEELERRAGRPMTARIGANESLFGPSPRVIEALSELSGDACLYGDPESFALRSALAAGHGVTIEHIALGAGIDELQGILAQAYLDPGDVVVSSFGSYPTWAYHIAGHGGRMITVPYQDYRNDLQALLDAARTHRAKLLYLANPDNPTGSFVTAADQLTMLEQLPPGCLLVLDEAYAPFAPDDALPAIALGDPRAIRLRTFSKAHGLAGMRVGYAIGAPEVVRPFDRIRNHFGVTRLSQVAALAALSDPDYTASVIDAVASGRADYVKLAGELGFHALPSVTNFVAIDVESAERAKAIVEALFVKEGIFIRMPGVPPLNRCIRVTVGRGQDRARFAEAFRHIMA